MIGLYLDALAMAGFDAAIDRVIVAQAWVAGDFSDGGARCLLGHTEDWDDCMWNDQAVETLSAELFPCCDVGLRFDGLVKRFGMERTVRAIKARAGKHTRITIPATPAPTECAVS